MRLLPLLVLLIACKKEEKVEEEVPDARFSLESPAPAAFLATGDNEASGEAENVKKLTVQGQTVKAEDGEFSTQIVLERGVSLVEATAVDLHGDTLLARNGVLAGEFGKPEERVEDAILLRLNQAGLDKLEDVVEGAVTPEVLNGAMGGANPIYEYVVDVWGWEAGALYVDLVRVDFTGVDVQIQPGGGNLDLVLTLENLDVAMNAYGSALGIDLNATMGMGADEAVITATITGGATEDGGIAIELLNTDVSLNGFWYDLSFIPSILTDFILVDTIAATVEGMLVDQITALVPPLVEETLAGLAPSVTTTLLDREVTLSYGFRELEIDDDGLAISLDLGVDITGELTKSSPGYLVAPYADPTISRRAEVGGAISDNLMNRVLYEAWRVGMLDMTLSTADGSLDSFMLAPLHATSGSISTRADLPPVIIGVDQKIQVQLGEMFVRIETDDSDLGTFLELSLTVKADLDLRIEGGKLVLDLGEPTIGMIVRDSDWGASDEATTKLVEESLPIDLILALLGNLSFDLPSLYGITIDEGQAGRDEGNSHTDVTLGLGVAN